MAIALKIVTGQVRQFAAADAIEVDAVSLRQTGLGNDLTIGANMTGADGEVQLGTVNNDTRVLGDLFVDGSATVASTTNLNGSVNLGDGTGDTIDIGGGGTDVVNLQNNLNVGAGLVSIGTSTTDYVSALWHDSAEGAATVGPNLAAYDLGASGTNAGAYAIGIDAALLTNISLPVGTTDLMSALDAIDAAIGASSSTLQDAYDNGSTITEDNTEQNVTIARGTNTTNEVLLLSDDTDSSNTTLSISKLPPTAAAGNIVAITMNNGNFSGSGVFLDVVFDSLDPVAGTAPIRIESSSDYTYLGDGSIDVLSSSSHTNLAPAIRVRKNGSAAADHGILVEMLESTATSAGVRVTSSSSDVAARGIEFLVGTATAWDGVGLLVDAQTNGSTSSTGAGQEINWRGSGSALAITHDGGAANAFTGDIVSIDGTSLAASSTGDALQITMDNAGRGIYIDHNGTGAYAALEIDSAGSSGGAAAIRVNYDGSDADGVQIIRGGAANTGGNVLSVNALTAAAASGNALVFVGEAFSGNGENIEFDYRDFTVDRNGTSDATYAFAASTVTVANGIGTNWSMTGGNGIGTGDGGDLTFNAGSATGTGTDGTISIGVTTASQITIGLAGASGNPTLVNHAEVTGSAGDAVVALNATGATTAGSYAIGCYDDPTWTAISPANSDLQSVLDAIDAAIGSGGAIPSLEDVITLAASVDNNVDLSGIIAANPVILSDGASASTNAALTIARTGAGAGAAFAVTMGASTTGNAIQATATAGATGDLLRLTDTASSGVLVVTAAGDATLGTEAASSTYFKANKGGALELVAADDQAVTASTQNTGGTITASFAADTAVTNRIELRATNVGADDQLLYFTGSKSFLRAENLAASKTPDQEVAALNNFSGAHAGGNINIATLGTVAGAAAGGIVIQANANTVTPTTAVAGQVLVRSDDKVELTTTQASSTVTLLADNATADIVFDARAASSPLTYNQSGETDLNLTATGEIFDGATSIVGALRRLGTVVNNLSATGAPTATLTAATGGVTAGNVVTLNGSGEMAPADANSGAQPIAGIALSTVAAASTGKVATAGLVTGLSGLTPGATYYLSTTAGGLTATAPSGTGDFVVRIGYAVSATSLILQIGEGVVL